MKSYCAKESEIRKEWHVIDAEDKTLGRIATQIALRLRGKHKPTYTPHVDTGDFVVVVNAEKIKLTGNKLTRKNYYHYTGYPGGIRSSNAETVLSKHPTRVLRHAVKGMLPKNKLGRKMLKKLKIYTGSDHPHQAQQPKNLELKGV